MNSIQSGKDAAARQNSVPDIFISVIQDNGLNQPHGLMSFAIQHQNLTVSVQKNSVSAYYRAMGQPYEFAVRFLPRSSLPVMIGADGMPVFLFSLVEEWDASTDYEELQKKFPTLSVGQIGGAIQFIRKLTQFNTSGIDIDEIDDESLECSIDFQNVLKASFKEQSSSDVFNLINSHS